MLPKQIVRVIALWHFQLTSRPNFVAQAMFPNYFPNSLNLWIAGYIVHIKKKERKPSLRVEKFPIIAFKCLGALNFRKLKIKLLTRGKYYFLVFPFSVKTFEGKKTSKATITYHELVISLEFREKINFCFHSKVIVTNLYPSSIQFSSFILQK